MNTRTMAGDTDLHVADNLQHCQCSCPTLYAGARLDDGLHRLCKEALSHACLVVHLNIF